MQIFFVSGGSATAAIVRLDLSNNPVWTQGFNFNVFQKMFKIDSSEQNIYKDYFISKQLKN